MTTPKVGLRYCVNQDMNSLVRIDQETMLHPWDADTFREMVHKPSTYALIGEVDDRVAGYLLYEKRKTQIILVRMAVCLRMQRQGIGTVLLTRIKGTFPMVTRLRETNLPALMFFKKNLFRAAQIIRGHYGDEDAIVMQWESASN